MNGVEMAGICIAALIGMVAAFWVIIDVLARYPLLCGGLVMLAVGCAMVVFVAAYGYIFIFIGIVLLVASGAKEG